ncbi:UNVERIFIED_CONTAM: hypothetical protein Cloal_2748 [Acetivibrio alkalicellulosi]
MLCENLKVVNLNITEDNYEYKALFRLCTESVCMDIDLAKITDESFLNEIKNTFQLEESPEEIKEIIMQKVMDASSIESHVSEGKSCCKENTDEKTQRGIDSLSTS